MPIVSTDVNRPSHVIKWELNHVHNYSRSKVTNVDAPVGREVGEVLILNGAGDQWITPVTIVAADAVAGILVDPAVYDILDDTITEADLCVVEKDAIAAEPHLIFDAGLVAGDITTLKTQLEAAGIELAAAVNTKD